MRSRESDDWKDGYREGFDEGMMAGLTIAVCAAGLIALLYLAGTHLAW